MKRFAVLYGAAKAKAKAPAGVFDGEASATPSDGNTLLGALHPAPAEDGASSLLKLFTRAS